MQEEVLLLLSGGGKGLGKISAAAGHLKSRVNARVMEPQVVRNTTAALHLPLFLSLSLLLCGERGGGRGLLSVSSKNISARLPFFWGNL